MVELQNFLNAARIEQGVRPHNQWMQCNLPSSALEVLHIMCYITLYAL